MDASYDIRCSCSNCIKHWRRERSGQLTQPTTSNLEAVNSFPESPIPAHGRAKTSSPLCKLTMLADMPPVTDGWIRRKISMVPPFPRHIQLERHENDTFRIMAKCSHATAESSSDEDEETRSGAYSSKKRSGSAAVIRHLLAPETHKEHDFQRVKFSPALEFIVFPKGSDASTSSFLFPLNEIQDVSVADNDSDMSKSTVVENTSNGSYCFLGVTTTDLDRLAEEYEKLLPSVATSSDSEPPLELSENKKPIEICHFYLPENRLTNSVGTLDRIRRDFTRVPKVCSSPELDEYLSHRSEESSSDKLRARDYFCRAVLVIFLLLIIAFCCGVMYHQFFYED